MKDYSDLERAVLLQEGLKTFPTFSCSTVGLVNYHMGGLHRVAQVSNLRSIRNTWCIDNSLSTEAGDRAAESYQAGSTKEGQLCRPPAPGQASQDWFVSASYVSRTIVRPGPAHDSGMVWSHCHSWSHRSPHGLFLRNFRLKAPLQITGIWLRCRISICCVSQERLCRIRR